MLLAVARIPDRVDARADAARVVGLAAADVNRRLAGVLPRVLATGLDAAVAEAQAAALETLGFLTFTFDAQAVPSDADRVVVARLEVSGAELRASDAAGRTYACPGAAIALVQRGVRVVASRETVKTRERKPALGAALLTGGLVLSKKIDKTTVRVTETREPFLLVQRRDGEPDLVLYERRLDYRFLGAEMQPMSHANLERVGARLRAFAPAAALDERVVRPGFVSGLPLTKADPVDLALYLVTLARAREAQEG